MQGGAKIIYGDNRPELDSPFDRGFFYVPMVFVNVNQNMRVVQEEDSDVGKQKAI